MRVLFSNRKGGAAVEFAMALPVLVTLVIGTLQAGMVYEASSGLRFATDEAARYASIYPRPSDTEIQTRLLSKVFGIQPANVSVSFAHGTSSSVAWVDITATASVPTAVAFLNLPAISFTEHRRAYQP